MNLQSELQLILINFALGILPFGIAASTSYLKMSLVLGFLRQALGGVGLPSNLLIFFLSLVLSLQVMAPVLSQIDQEYSNLQQPSVSQELNWKSFFSQLEQVLDPLKDFLIRNIESNVLGDEAPKGRNWRELFLSFTISEFKEGLLIGLCLLLPFVIIDFVVSNILVALGLSMLPPSAISLPLKVALLVYSELLGTIFKVLLRSYA